MLGTAVLFLSAGPISYMPPYEIKHRLLGSPACQGLNPLQKGESFAPNHYRLPKIVGHLSVSKKCLANSPSRASDRNRQHRNLPWNSLHGDKKARDQFPVSAIVNSVSHVGPYSIALKYSKVQNPLNGNKIVLQTVTRESSRLQKAGRSVKDLDVFVSSSNGVRVCDRIT